MAKRKASAKVSKKRKLPVAGALEDLVKFLGRDLLLEIRGYAIAHGTRECVEIPGQVMGGHFNITLIFDGGGRH